MGSSGKRPTLVALCTTKQIPVTADCCGGAECRSPSLHYFELKSSDLNRFHDWTNQHPLRGQRLLLALFFKLQCGRFSQTCKTVSNKKKSKELLSSFGHSLAQHSGASRLTMRWKRTSSVTLCTSGMPHAHRSTGSGSERPGKCR